MKSFRLAVVALCTAASCSSWVAAQAPAKPSPSVKSRIHDLLVLKNSESMNGNVKVDVFTLKTQYGDLKLKKSDILSVDFKKPPNRMQDEVQVSAGSRLYGDLQPTPIPFDFEESGQILNVPKADILTMTLQAPIEDVSPATRDALKALKKKP